VDYIIHVVELLWEPQDLADILLGLTVNIPLQVKTEGLAAEVE